MLTSGNILHIKDFEFSDGSIKDKYLIVICYKDKDCVIVSLPSTQIYINQEDIKCGCISTDTKHCYHFPANKVIGKNGFFFPIDTFLYFSQLKPIAEENMMKKYINTQKAKLLDSIINDEYKELVYCAYKGKQISKRIKLILEKHLEDIYD